MVGFAFFEERDGVLANQGYVFQVQNNLLFARFRPDERLQFGDIFLVNATAESKDLPVRNCVSNFLRG